MLSEMPNNENTIVPFYFIQFHCIFCAVKLVQSSFDMPAQGKAWEIFCLR